MATDQLLQPFADQYEQSQKDLAAAKVRAEHREQAEASSELTGLQDELQMAVVERDAAQALLKLAEEAYARAGDTPSSVVIANLQRHQGAVRAALNKVEMLERNIVKVRDTLKQEDYQAEFLRRRARVAHTPL